MTNNIHVLNIVNNNQMPFLQYIKNGIKKAECRIASDKIRKFKIRDKLKLRNNQEFIVCDIVFMNFYKNFEDMIYSEGLKNRVPFGDTVEDGLKIYNSFPGSERVTKLGCCAIGVKYITGKLNFEL